MKKQDIVFGSFLLLIVLVTYFYFKNQSNLSVPTEPVPTVSLDEKVEGRFDTKLPENVEKTELKPLALGSSFAAATREYVNGQFNLAILADLPDPEAGQFYQAWLNSLALVNSDKLKAAGFLNLAQTSTIQSIMMWPSPLNPPSTPPPKKPSSKALSNIFISHNIAFLSQKCYHP